MYVFCFSELRQKPHIFNLMMNSQYNIYTENAHQKLRQVQNSIICAMAPTQHFNHASAVSMRVSSQLFKNTRHRTPALHEGPSFLSSGHPAIRYRHAKA